MDIDEILEALSEMDDNVDLDVHRLIILTKYMAKYIQDNL